MKLKLFWVTTEDHDEDWFVIALNKRQALLFFENFEGYDPGEAWAEEILPIPEDIRCKAGWPGHDLLVALGAKFLVKGHTRVVEINGRKFCEGMLESLVCEKNDNLLEDIGEGRPNKTQKSTRQ